MGTSFWNEEEQLEDYLVTPEWKSEDEILHHIHRNAEHPPEEYQRGNLLYTKPCWLYRGRDRLKIAQLLIIRKREDGTERKGLYLYIQYWQRKNRDSSPLYEMVKDFRLDCTSVSALLSYLLQGQVTTQLESEGVALPVSMAEVFENLDDSQRQTFAHILKDLALTHRLSELYEQGHLSLPTLNHLSAAAHHIYYKASLHELRDMVEGIQTTWIQDGKAKPVNEHAYQHWFEQHPWVFGTEYVRKINLREIEPSAKIDLALETVDGFLDILELKQPKVELLQFDKSHDTWYFAPDISKVLAQAAKYIDAVDRKTEDMYYRTRNWEKPIHFVRPRVRVIVGRSHTWKIEQHESFRRLKATLHCIELLTYDHVLQQAEQLVNRYERSVDLETVSLDKSMEFITRV